MAIEVCNLSGGYGQHLALTEIDLTIHGGEWLCLVGANGSGKSTLLKSIGRILKPQAGSVLLDGKVIHQQPAHRVAQQLAFLPQHQAIPTDLTVAQLACLGRTPHQPWWRSELTPSDRQAVAEALHLTELESYRDYPVAQLSGGERQRAFLALALAQQPKILLLDEPTTYLDLHYQLQLLALLRQLNQQRSLTVVTALHDLNLALRFCDRIALLKQGKLLALGPAAEVLVPEAIATAFGVEVALVETPVGLQICPLSASSVPLA